MAVRSSRDLSALTMNGGLLIPLFIMDLGLKGKRALVTGSTAGIGFATAELLAREGASVTVNGRTAERVEAAVQRIRQAAPGATVSGVAADVGSAAGCDAVIAAQPELDVLVNNMGIFEPKPFEQITDAEWLHFFEVNVLSGIRLSRHYAAGMKARNWGRIVFVSSESAVQIPTEMIHYGMTKTAQLAVARGLAETLIGTQVTVNSVLPGPTSSEGVGTFVADLAASQGKSAATVEREFFQSARPTSLIQRFATPVEVASLIAYVCSAAASATTGSALRVDGGVIRAIA
jgi:NAD(P)-dependent dehydrogenase (short-subunit alcohol dehydrogenase family)